MAGAPEQVRLAEVLGALSLATDLGLGQPFELGLRACVLSVRLAQLLGFTPDEASDAYYLAASLGVSVKTVDAHLQSAYRKANVSTRAAATMFAMQHRLVDDG